jgi:hypothetical protein
MDAWAKAGRKHLVVIYYMIGGNVTLQKLTRRPAPWNGSRKVVLSNASLKSRLQVFVSHIISSRCSCAKVILCQESVSSNVVRQTAVHVFLQ